LSTQIHSIQFVIIIRTGQHSDIVQIFVLAINQTKTEIVMQISVILTKMMNIIPIIKNKLGRSLLVVMDQLILKLFNGKFIRSCLKNELKAFYSSLH
jgi:hypothetical protein